jgi:hypothetical protein
VPKKVAYKDLTPREGKLLRYVCTYTPGRLGPNVTTEMAAIPSAPIFNSDLPRTQAQARIAFGRLAKLGLIERVGKGYEPTEEGKAVEKAATKAGIWLK